MFKWILETIKTGSCEKLVPSIFPTKFIAIRNMSFVVLNWYISHPPVLEILVRVGGF